jgi:GntR family transcriptional repressor for pyruvate dehydrogenase complex
MIVSDLRFHRGLARAVHNRYFEMLLDPLMEVLSQQIKLTNAFNLGLESHRAVLKQVRARNPVGARQAMRRLIKQTLADCRKALKLYTPS